MSLPTSEDSAADDLSGRLEHAIDLVRREGGQQAEQALLAVLERWPDQPDALHFLGVLRHTQGQSEEALELLRRAAEQIPDHPTLWSNLGNVLLGAGQIEAATKAYEHSLELAAETQVSASPWNNLGIVYRAQGRLNDAETACRNAVALAPQMAEAWYNLSLVLIDRGEIAEGMQANSRAIALWPRHLTARDQVIRALILLGERERAAELYREWLAEDPDNPVVQHQLAACIGNQPPERASDAYVTEVFDAFATSFDAKLEALAYRAPQHVAQALAAHAGAASGSLDIVDAGCGTGLCGPLLRPWARYLAGCDLSKGMLRLAVPRKVYDVLHQAELVYYLDTQPGRFDVVVSADTLCYFGVLETAMAAAHRCLRPGGWLIFTVEAQAGMADSGHTLQANGRYAHSRAYVQHVLATAGLVCVAIQAEVLRNEAGRPVSGWLVSATKP